MKWYEQYHFILAKILYIYIYIPKRTDSKLSIVISGWWNYELFIFLVLLLCFFPHNYLQCSDMTVVVMKD